MEDFIVFVIVCAIIIILLRTTLKDNNYFEILKYINANNMRQYKKVDCIYTSILSFENRIFDIYINDDYIIILSDSDNKIIQHRYFAENYLVFINSKRDESLCELFINHIALDKLSNDKFLTIQGKLYGKSIFHNTYNYINKIKIETSLAV